MNIIIKRLFLITICLSVAQLSIAQTNIKQASKHEAGSYTLTWFSTNEFVDAQKSDFVVNLNATINGKDITLNIESGKAGNVFVFGASSTSHNIYPLCDDYQYVNKNSSANLQCENEPFTQNKGDKLIFAFVVDSENDIQKIKRFMQLRAGLSDDAIFKGLHFQRPQAEANTTHLQGSLPEPQDDLDAQNDLGVGFIRAQLI